MTAVVVDLTLQEVSFRASISRQRADKLAITGLSVHMNQVHKENLSQVENALPNRQGLEVEIFGMEGIPQDILDQHRNRILQNFQQAQKDRQIATGNPLPGQAMNNPRKKLKIESASELKKRLEEFRARKKDIAANGGVDAAAATTTTENQATFVSYSVCFCAAYANMCRMHPLIKHHRRPTSNQGILHNQHLVLRRPMVTRPTRYLRGHHQAALPLLQASLSGRHQAALGTVQPPLLVTTLTS